MTAQSPCKWKTPFLHRNWLKGVGAFQGPSVMGNILSSSLHKLPHHGDGDDLRPAKRRRISSPDMLDVDQLIASPRLSESGSTLRIEVLKILHKDTKKVRSYQGTAVPRDVVTTKARCKVTICDMSSGPPQVLHCQSQICDLTTFKNPVGPHRITRVDLPRPFFVTHDSVLINRPDDGGFALSDSYQLLIDLEAASATHWPPLSSQDFGISAESLYPPWGTTQHWVMTSKFDTVFGRLKNPLSLSARYPSSETYYQTNYLMDVDLRWTNGFKALRRLEKGSMPCITAIDPDVDPYSDNAINSYSNGAELFHVNGHAPSNESLQDQDDDFSGDQTPSRSLRARGGTKVYNLKVLSDQQLGRDRKKRERSVHDAVNEGRVQYLLPTDQPVSLDLYRCINCGVCHESMDHLQLHLQHSHPTYDYTLEQTGQGQALFRVSLLREVTASPKRTINLGRTLKPFNIQTIISTDQAWLMSRLSSDGDEIFKSPARAPFDRARIGSPIAKAPKVPLRRHEGARQNKSLVPDIPHRLFHPVSKARLRPGQEVPRNVPDDTWLIQKHRESISDFSDVTPAEKEYIWEWDGFILRQGITSVAYFARAWLHFVEEKASWLASSERRMLEFGKHASMLLARDTLDGEDMQQAFRFINEARARNPNSSDAQKQTASQQANDAPLKQSPRASQIRKGSNGCAVCQLPVYGPRMLLCSEKVR
ncbi:Polycomb protein, VEFS-Box [Moelleriella libera RCEF 2490]|uniref:Polycomb protein, VEFS-Box n=1 Tax=Moelleriella libera RCEF 2490 TaxID=1081109 RepID=A0A168B755_9HYPO|nr:Polycomb protein, VEFS-Box [Moelleriella libera RCEF 2490]